jgi:hypothetical protein
MDAALVDLMGRYGVFNEESLRTIQPQGFPMNSTFQLSPGMELMPSSPGANLPDCNGEAESGSGVLQLRLLLQKARGVPEMDLFRGSDLFCVAFIGDWSSGQGMIDKGGRLFQTEIRRGRTEEDWTWNEVQHACYAVLKTYWLLQA